MLGIDVSFERMKKFTPYFILAIFIAFFGSGYIKEEIYLHISWQFSIRIAVKVSMKKY